MGRPSLTIAAAGTLGLAATAALMVSSGTQQPGANSAQSATPIGRKAASRMLTQGTFGPSLEAINDASTQTYNQWFAQQAKIPPTYMLERVRKGGKDTSWLPFWWEDAVMARDQLRQRMAFALSEIMVISVNSGAAGDNFSQAAYYDTLTRNALGNYRDLLEDVTRSPQMGLFLNSLRNDKPDPATNKHADENYAREVMQLFSIGLVELNPDGTPKLDADGKTIPTYGQSEVAGMARVFTGWSARPSKGLKGEQAWAYSSDYVHPMTAYQPHHDTDAKDIVGGIHLRAGRSAEADLKSALDALYNHPNTGPFIGKQLIERLVTSNPSPEYVQRVASVFADNGSGVRGDMLAVAKAILTDPEAVKAGGRGYGKLREPILRLTHLWRAFHAKDRSGGIRDYQIVFNARYTFAQAPLQAPSVFNFFVPDYVLAGPLARAGLVAPEFQITNEITAVNTANQLERQAYQYRNRAGETHFAPYGYEENSIGPTNVLLRTATWESVAENPEALVDRLSLVLMEDAMPKTMRTRLVAYVRNIHANEKDYRAKRAIEATSLIINSPQYSVQR